MIKKMRKIVLTLLSLVAVACQEKKAPTTTAEETPQVAQEKNTPTLTYSNLVDAPTQEKCSKRLSLLGYLLLMLPLSWRV